MQVIFSSCFTVIQWPARLTELGVDLETRFAVFEREVEARQLGVTRGSVAVDLGVLGVAQYCLRVVLQSARVVA